MLRKEHLADKNKLALKGYTYKAAESQGEVYKAGCDKSQLIVSNPNGFCAFAIVDW